MYDNQSVVVIEWRRPRNKKERRLFGCTEYVKGSNRAYIYLNADRNRRPKDKIDTIMHELYHAMCGLYNYAPRREEWRARFIGQMAAKITKKRSK